LYGGQGWWKYEYCHGKQVIQYHDFNDGATKRLEVSLGVWNEEVHRKWIDDNPHKAPVKVGTVLSSV
jgi:endoplasmic reticulum lectin 1